MVAGAAVLDIPLTGRNGILLPFVPRRYLPHQENWRRLERSRLDWALMCPGPMSPGDDLPVSQGLRMSIDTLPVDERPWVRYAPPLALSLLLKGALPRLRVSYRSVADCMADHLEPGGRFSRKRVGIAWIDLTRSGRFAHPE